MKNTTMPAVASDVDRVLTLIRNKIRERGFTQLEVQDMLGWGRSYISQLLTKQKALRLEQVLMILGVIGVDPCDFFGELYPFGGGPRGSAQWPAGPMGGGFAAIGAQGGACVERPPELTKSVSELRFLVRGLVGLLIDREVIDVDELSTAVETVEEDAPALGHNIVY